MTLQWIRQGSGRRLTVFFLGWGTDANALGGFDPEADDLLAVYDYTTLSADGLARAMAGYPSVRVAAWSMGVAAADELMPLTGADVEAAVAIGGTATPIDARLGIDPVMVEGTCRGWCDATRRKFDMRMAGGRAALAAAQRLMSVRSTADAQAELAAIIARRHTPSGFGWTRAIVGGADAIFAPANQLRSWQLASVPVRIVDAMPHLPFGFIGKAGELFG